MYQTKFVVMIPARDEEQTIGSMLDNIQAVFSSLGKKFDCLIVVVNDGSIAASILNDHVVKY